ncbi:MAG: hypothetical protein J6T10_12295 [Methanobrevibacter sp.]|nr:hypothetical protein [Methanobrevibacter sp.]
MPEEKKRDSGYWLSQFRKVRKDSQYQKWESSAKKLQRMYRNQQQSEDVDKAKKAKYNLMYRNIKVKMPYLVPTIPSVSVERQNKDNDAVARCSSIMLERSCNKFIEQDNLKQVLDKVKLDAEITGIGNLWVNYEPEFETVTVEAEGLDENGNLTLIQSEETRLKSEKIDFEYISCFDYLHNLASKKEEITWVAKRVRLSKNDFKKKFPDVDVADVPFTSNEEKAKYEVEVWNEAGVDSRDKNSDMISVWEVWDKETRKVYIFAPVMQDDGLLVEKDYPLEIDFPCVPEGLMFDEFNDTLIPTPRHYQVYDQYLKINNLTDEIFKVIDNVRVRGGYDEGCEGIQELLSSSNNNKLYPIKNASKYIEKGGLAGAIAWYDPTPAISVLDKLNAERDLLIKDVQNVLGVYDILEGESNPQEAYNTNRLKGTFGTQRIQEDQAKVIFFTQDILKIACQMICQLFEDESILKLSTIEYSTEDPNLFMPAIQLLKDKRLTDTRLEIASEDVKAYTDESYKQQIIELWKTVNEMLLQSANMIQQIPEMAGICKVSIMEVVRGFRVGRSVENKLEQAIDASIQAYMQNKANAEPTTDQKKLDLENKKLDLESQKTVAELQMQANRDQNNMNLENAKIAAQTEKLNVEREKLLKDMEIDAAKLKIQERDETRKETELQNEIDLAWYAAHHPDIKVDTNLGSWNS